MGDAKFTRGSWKAVEPIAIDYRAMQIQTDESLIAVCCGGGPKRAISAPEERANARLIASAPDLATELKNILPLVEWSVTAVDPLFKAKAERSVERIRAALSKAGV